MGLFRRITPYTLLISTLWLLPAYGSAQGVIDMGAMPDQDAKSHFKVGKSLYETGRFSEAAVEFEKAYKLSNRVELLYNVYVAHRDASDLPKAIDALRRYLQLAQLDESTRVNLVARLRAMEEASARGAPSPAATAAPRATGTEPAAPAAEPPQPAESAPPEPGPAPAPPPGSAELEMDADSSALPYALIAVGGAALAVGIVTAILAAGKISDLEDACPDDRCPPPSEFDLDAERDDARTLRTVAFALLGGGLIVGGAGATLLLLDAGDAAPSEAGTQAALRCAASGCTAALHGRF